MEQDLLSKLIMEDPDFKRKVEIRELNDKVTKAVRQESRNMFQKKYDKTKYQTGYKKSINNMFKDK